MINRFLVHLPLTLFTVIFLPILISLGFWQLQRAEQKRELEQALAAASIQPASPLAELDFKHNAIFTPLVVQGQYDNTHQFLLDNKTYQGQAGYHVLTPVHLNGVLANKIILVNRGWIPRGQEKHLSQLSETEVTLKGQWYAPPPPFLLQPENMTNGPWPQVIQAVNFVNMGSLLGVEVLPATVRLLPEEPNGFVREWQTEAFSVSSEKHKAYAVQWFALALTLLVLYGWFIGRTGNE